MPDLDEANAIAGEVARKQKGMLESKLNKLLEAEREYDSKQAQKVNLDGVLSCFIHSRSWVDLAYCFTF